MAKPSHYKFKTEAKQLLDLMIHSVYSNKDIFLRELISNSSDALDKLRFEALKDSALEDARGEAMIRIHVDEEQRTLGVEDNGIGMDREELREFIGIIAKSGSKEYLKLLEQAKESDLPPELIGQFGVGFYSCFMVADKVTIHTRKAGVDEGWMWVSTGDGTYTIAEEAREKPGTTVTVFLKDADPDGGLNDYTQQWVIKEIVKKYSDFVSYPVVMEVERVEYEKDEKGNFKEGGASKTIREDQTINSMKAIWTRSQADVSDEEYREFYRHITRDWEEPLTHTVAAAEGATEFRMLLYVPSKAPYDLFMHDAPHGVQLYIKRVFIMSDCKELLPFHLRFVKGVVDSEDLSLNISREILQQDRTIKIIRKNLVRKVYKMLEDLEKDDPEKYKTFWGQFGKVLKEGIFQDQTSRDKLLELSFFDSTNSDSERTTLDEYVERMKEGQDTIYFMTGKSREMIASSPHLEAFKAKGFEVLLLSDPVDEVWTQGAPEFKEKKFQSVGKGTVELDTDEEKEEAGKERKEREESHKDLLEHLQKTLDEHVKEVRLSTRLTDSPACLVGDEMDLSPQLEQMLRASGQEMPKTKRVLELNPSHPILETLQALFVESKDDPRIDRYAFVLHGQAVLAEGGSLADPASFTHHLTEVMLEAIK